MGPRLPTKQTGVSPVLWEVSSLLLRTAVVLAQVVWSSIAVGSIVLIVLGIVGAAVFLRRVAQDTNDPT